MIEKSIKLILFLATGAFLYLLIYNGTLETYIHPRFSYLTLVAALGLFLVGVSYFRADGDLAHEHRSVAWWGLLIIAVPVVLGWMVPARPLGATAMNTREVSVVGLSSISASGSEDLTMARPNTERNILDWINLFQNTQEWSGFVGEEVDVVGFVYRDERFGSDELMISRFVVSCCAADGQPIGLIVRADDASVWTDDQWLEIRGTIELGEFNGLTLPLLMADEMVAVEAPAQPYLYP